MTKSELLKRIREAIRTEETATSIYLEHLSAIVERTELPLNAIERIRKGTEHLVSENRRHKKLLEDLGFRVEMGDANVY